MLTDLKTPQEERLLFAFRNMTQEAQECVVPYVEAMRDQYPAYKTPMLRVVAGGNQPKPTKRRRKAPSLSIVRGGAA